MLKHCSMPVKPDGISQEGKCVTSEVDATCATKQNVSKGGDTIDDNVDVGPVCYGFIQSSEPTDRKHGRRKAEQQEMWLFGPSWVPHRKHGRHKTERQQRELPGLCRPTHRKHGRWKLNPIEVQSPQLQLRSDETRRWCSQRKRVKWKSGNRDDSNGCLPDDARCTLNSIRRTFEYIF